MGKSKIHRQILKNGLCDIREFKELVKNNTFLDLMMGDKLDSCNVNLYLVDGSFDFNYKSISSTLSMVDDKSVLPKNYVIYHDSVNPDSSESMSSMTEGKLIKMFLK